MPKRAAIGSAPFISKAGGVRRSRGGDVTIQSCGGEAEAVRDLRHADVGIGEHRLRGFEVVPVRFSGQPPVPTAGRPTARLNTFRRLAQSAAALISALIR